MAIAATIVWEVRTTGSDVNSGGFKTGASGTDWSQQAAAQYAVTDGVTAGTTTITSLTANFGVDVVGNLIYVAGGTGSLTGVWREITARASTTSITVDAVTGLAASTGCTLNIGGALLSPGAAGFSKVLGNDVWIAAGTYTLTTTTPNVAGGPVSDTTGGAAGTNPSRWEGYQTTRGDKGTKPVISAGALATFTMFATTGSAVEVDNIALNNPSAGAAVVGFSIGGPRGYIGRCKVSAMTGIGISFVTDTGMTAYRCEATTCTNASGAIVAGVPVNFIECEAYANTTIGFSSTGTSVAFVRCIASANSGASSDGFQSSGRNGIWFGCVAYNNGRHGFNVGGTGPQILQNCLSEGNVATPAYGYTNTAAVTAETFLINCGGFNNTTGNVNATQITTATVAFVTGSATFFTNAGTGDFSLNNTAGGGAAARAAGLGTMPRGTTTGSPDIGAAQHADPAAAGMLYNAGLYGSFVG